MNLIDLIDLIIVSNGPKQPGFSWNLEARSLKNQREASQSYFRCCPVHLITPSFGLVSLDRHETQKNRMDQSHQHGTT